MSFTSTIRVSCLLAFITMLASLEFAKTQSFETDCCGDGMPLTARSVEEIQAQETAHAIIVNFTRSLNVVCM